MTEIEIRKIFYNYYKEYINKFEKQEIDYSFHNALPINEPDYKIYNIKAYNYALHKLQLLQKNYKR